MSRARGLLEYGLHRTDATGERNSTLYTRTLYAYLPVVIELLLHIMMMMMMMMMCTVCDACIQLVVSHDDDDVYVQCRTFCDKMYSLCIELAG
jgi:hypothetical protein